MARYSTFKYGAAKYGSSSTNTLVWAFEVDWDGDGAFDGYVEAGRIVSINSISRGRSFMVNASSDRFENAQPGRLVITLDNQDRRYNANNLTSPLHGKIDTGKLARLKVRYGSATYPVFCGVLTNIKVTRSTGTATFTVEDGLLLLQLQKVEGTGFPLSIADGNSATANTCIAAILADVEWPSALGYELDTGVEVKRWWWPMPGSALDQIQSLVDSEFGTFFIDRNGAAHFHDRYHSQAPVVTITQDLLGFDLETTQPWENQKHLVNIKWHAYRRDTAVSVRWSTTDELVLSAGETQEWQVETGEATHSYLAPVSGTDWTAWTASGGTGSAADADISMSIVRYGPGMLHLRATNLAGSTRYINLRQVRGYAMLDTPYQVSDGLNDSLFNQAIDLDLDWMEDGNTASTLAGILHTLLSSLSPLPMVTIINRPDLQFGLELFDFVLVSIDAENINALFRLGHIEHRFIGPSCQAVQTTYTFEPYLTSGAYWIFPVTFNTTSILGF